MPPLICHLSKSENLVDFNVLRLSVGVMIERAGSDRVNAMGSQDAFITIVCGLIESMPWVSVMLLIFTPREAGYTEWQ
jgi:hypothetical protein